MLFHDPIIGTLGSEGYVKPNVMSKNNLAIYASVSIIGDACYCVCVNGGYGTSFT